MKISEYFLEKNLRRVLQIPEKWDSRCFGDQITVFKWLDEERKDKLYNLAYIGIDMSNRQVRIIYHELVSELNYSINSTSPDDICYILKKEFGTPGVRDLFVPELFYTE